MWHWACPEDFGKPSDIAEIVVYGMYPKPDINSKMIFGFGMILLMTFA